MKQSQSKKPNIKIAIDRTTFNSLIANQLDQQLSQRCTPSTFSSGSRNSALSKQVTEKISQPALSQNSSHKNLKFPKKQPINSADISKCYQDNEELIQLLIQENMQLQKQNLARDTLITQLIIKSTRNNPNIHRANTSNAEQGYFIEEKWNQGKQQMRSSADQIKCSPLGFTFCNANSITEQSGFGTIKTQKSPNRLPEEFHIRPSSKRYFV